MTTPAPVLTITPNTVTQTAANLAPAVVLADTATHTPVASARDFQFDTVSAVKTTGATGAGISSGVNFNVNLAAGTRQGRVRTTNTDGQGTSSNVALTVTDNVATAYATPTYVDNNKIVSRFLPEQLPMEYRDPTMATPGLPTAGGTYNARTRGTIL
jgi:hypothetical protein